MRIALDLDNTVISTTETLVNYINERIPVNLKMSDITTYSIEAALPEQYRWIVENGFTDKNMWKKVELLPHVGQVLEWIYREGHEIWFATSSLPENLRKKINHLARNLSFLPDGYVWRHTINIHDKYLLDVDVLVDDCAEHLLHPSRKYYSIAIDYPWNQTEGAIPMFTRASNWFEVWSKIHMIEALLGENEDDCV